MTRPTAFADRLVERLVPGQDHDALLGDVREERERGRSALWFGVQILAAILIGSRQAGYPTTSTVDALLRISSDMLLGWSLVSADRRRHEPASPAASVAPHRRPAR
jgi:hypothetical protein